MMEKLTCSVADAHEALGISERTLYDLIKDGRVATVKLGARRLVVMQSLRELVNSLSTNQATSRSFIQAQVGARRRRRSEANAH